MRTSVADSSTWTWSAPLAGALGTPWDTGLGVLSGVAAWTGWARGTGTPGARGAGVLSPWGLAGAGAAGWTAAGDFLA